MGCAQLQQSEIRFRSIKSLGLSKKKASFSNGTNASPNGKSTPTKKKIIKDEKLQKLRIPHEICQILPSVKKYSGGKGFVDITDDTDSVVSDDVKSEASTNSVLGVRKGRGQHHKYQLKLQVEHRFAGMIWDLAFLGNGDIVVACGEGLLLCDKDLEKYSTLTEVRLAGGVDCLSNGTIVAVCRFADEVYLFSPQGNMIRSFPAGDCPMTVAVNSKDEIFVADPGSKEIHVFRENGTKIRSIGPQLSSCKLSWPLYLTTLKDKNTLVVCDCHQQMVLLVDSKGRYLRTLQLTTSGGNEVLRPHGICSTPAGDLLVVDNSIDSVEAFTAGSVYVQNLLPPTDGATLRPKVLTYSQDGRFLAIGGMKGHVKVYEMEDPSETKPEIKPLKSVKKEPQAECTDNDVIVLD